MISQKLVMNELWVTDAIIVGKISQKPSILHKKTCHNKCTSYVAGHILFKELLDMSANKELRSLKLKRPSSCAQAHLHSCSEIICQKCLVSQKGMFMNNFCLKNFSVSSKINKTWCEKRWPFSWSETPRQPFLIRNNCIWHVKWWTTLFQRIVLICV